MVPVRDHFVIFFTKHPQWILAKDDESGRLVFAGLIEAELDHVHLGPAAGDLAENLKVQDSLAGLAMRVDRLDAERVGGDAGGNLAALPLLENLPEGVARGGLGREEAFVTPATASG